LTTIRQVKAARALLGWSQSDLARHSGISEPTIARLESAEGQLGGRGGTVKKIRAHFVRHRNGTYVQIFILHVKVV